MGVSSKTETETAPDSAPSRSRLRTRAGLLEAGRRLFAERGLHNVTTHDIAREAGVAAGTFYLHFADKAALFREIANEAVAELRDRLEKSLVGQPDLEASVRAHASALVGFAEDQRDLIRILFSGDSEAAAVESDVLHELAEVIATTRRRRIESGDHPAKLHPAVLGQAIVGMWSRVVAWWAEDPTRADREQVIETIVHIQLSGTNPVGRS